MKYSLMKGQCIRAISMRESLKRPRLVIKKEIYPRAGAHEREKERERESPQLRIRLPFKYERQATVNITYDELFVRAYLLTRVVANDAFVRRR